MTVDIRASQSDVRPITIDELDRLGINCNHELFWDGKPIEIRRHFVLTRLQKIAASIVSICAILGGLGALASGIKDGSEFLCARQATWVSCPSAAAVAASHPSLPPAVTPSPELTPPAGR